MPTYVIKLKYGILNVEKPDLELLVKSQSLTVNGVFEVLEVFTAVGPKYDKPWFLNKPNKLLN